VIFRNRTNLDSTRLLDMCASAIDGWPHEGLSVWVRHSRGADFSGACHYASRRIYVNIGQNIDYPYLLRTHIARAQSNPHGWSRALYSLALSDGYQLTLFIFLHEFYHWLVKAAGRNPRQKEAMCDRFATRTLVDRWGAAIRDDFGVLVPREEWDFRDLDGFVRAAGPRRLVGAASAGGRSGRK
jgi:hypothetical protein